MQWPRPCSQEAGASAHAGARTRNSRGRVDQRSSRSLQGNRLIVETRSDYLTQVLVWGRITQLCLTSNVAVKLEKALNYNRDF